MGTQTVIFWFLFGVRVSSPTLVCRDSLIEIMSNVQVRDLESNIRTPLHEVFRSVAQYNYLSF